MNHHPPYAGYGGPPPRGEYGGPSHLPPHVPPMAGSPHMYGADPYGSGAPNQYVQHRPRPPPPPHMHPHNGPASAYGREGPNMYGGPPPPMGNQPPLHGRDAHAAPPPPPPPPQQQQQMRPGAYGGPVSSYGPPLHFDSARPPMPSGSGMEYRGTAQGPQKRPYEHHDSTPQYTEHSHYPPPGPSPAQNAPPYGGGGPPGWDQGMNSQPRKRSRVDQEGGEEEDTYSDYLQERLARERPCRTLFVRNIDFTANVAELRAQFESFGEIKTWFDLIQKRGIAFITYYDIRAAEAARNSLQSAQMGGRQLDVHFSLPRESEMSKRCDRDKDQGTLFLVLKRAPDDLNDAEIANLFAPFGEIKNLRPYKDQPNCRFIEFWDCRATKAAHDAIINSEYRGGVWDVKFAWDQGIAERLPDMAKHERDRERLNKMGYRHGDGRGNPRGGRDRGGGGGGQRGGSKEGDKGFEGGYGNGVKRPFNQDSGYGGTSHEQPVMRRWGQPQPSAYGTGSGAGSPPVHGAPAGGAAGYGTPPMGSGGTQATSARPPPPSSVASAQPSTGPSGDANRLEQAQKVQQLLASLKPVSATPSTAPASSGPAATSSGIANGGSGGGGNGAGTGKTAGALPSNLAALLQMAQNNSGGAQAKK